MRKKEREAMARNLILHGVDEYRPEYRTMRVQLPNELADQINERALALGCSRDVYLTSVLQDVMEIMEES